MMDYGQESSRAGRDGGRREAVVVRGGGGKAGADADAGIEDELIGRYTDPASKKCWRIIMDEYFGGRSERVGCEEGERAVRQLRGERTSRGGCSGSRSRSRKVEGSANAAVNTVAELEAERRRE